VSTGTQLPMFRNIVVPSSSGSLYDPEDELSFETLVTIYQATRSHILDTRIPSEDSIGRLHQTTRGHIPQAGYLIGHA
jgi:hypothetical protein